MLLAFTYSFCNCRIIARLLAEGFRDDVNRIGSKTLERSLRRPQAKFARKRLTDESWVEIKPKVLLWMKRVVREKVMAVRFKRCSKYINNWVRDNWSAYDNPTDPIPSETLGPADWLLLPPIKKILDLPNCDRLLKHTIARSLGDDHKLALVWYRTRQGFLLSKLGQSDGPSDRQSTDVTDFDDLRLAAHTFSCSSCHLQFMSFRKALIHWCRPVHCTYPALSLNTRLWRPVIWAPKSNLSSRTAGIPTSFGSTRGSCHIRPALSSRH
ncbi:hypothetical protein C8Q80DRAFT_713236 [Daedaleopsis nitida]|nr:hypothetical protein C8Q80DRAFT_713236 [Daedaleopsis nitida]